MVSLHMSQEQILALYASLSFNGADYGISSLSRRLYSKPPSSLSEPEAATVVAILRAPTYCKANSPRLERLRDTLIARSHAGIQDP